ncbi:alpha/beta hydrolase [Betaproteobacteria bacterium GR16-43]|nr:alpha/beta hydrolase [Betaproteobacteria bacterium GR16-43]
MSAVHGADPAAKIGSHLTPNHRIGDLLAHPAFAPYGRLLLPWDGRRYDESLRLAQVGSLLPYHGHVDADDVVSALNRMIDERASGKTVFYDFYSEAEKKSDPSKRNTGLFFYRGKPGAPFALIAPGGGFEYVGSLHEGFPYADEISKRGYNAFVVKYRAGAGATVATEDMAQALSHILRNASTLEVGTASYSLWGSSAGARMAAAIGSHGAEQFGGDKLPKPSVVVMAYTGHSDHATSEPATFVVVGENDGIAPPATMERRVQALRARGTEVEYLKFANVGHGFGVGRGTSAEGWVGKATRFWEKHMGTTR